MYSSIGSHHYLSALGSALRRSEGTLQTNFVAVSGPKGLGLDHERAYLGVSRHMYEALAQKTGFTQCCFPTRKHGYLVGPRMQRSAGKQHRRSNVTSLIVVYQERSVVLEGYLLSLYT